METFYKNYFVYNVNYKGKIEKVLVINRVLFKGRTLQSHWKFTVEILS